METCRFCAVKYDALLWQEWRTKAEEKTGLQLDLRERKRRAAAFDADAMREHVRCCGCYTCLKHPACAGDGVGCIARVASAERIAKLQTMDAHRAAELAKCQAHAEAIA